MGGGSGGGGRPGRSGGGGGGDSLPDNQQPGEVFREANKANQMTESQRADAFIDKLMAERKAKEAKKAAPTRYERMQGGPSVRDEGPSYRRPSNEEVAARMKRNPYNPPKADKDTVYNPYG